MLRLTDRWLLLVSLLFGTLSLALREVRLCGTIIVVLSLATLFTVAIIFHRCKTDTLALLSGLVAARATLSLLLYDASLLLLNRLIFLIRSLFLFRCGLWLYPVPSRCYFRLGVEIVLLLLLVDQWMLLDRLRARAFCRLDVKRLVVGHLVHARLKLHNP